MGKNAKIASKGELDMDLTNLVTIIAIAFANIGTVLGLFTWATNRSEENRKELQSSIEDNRKEAQSTMEAYRSTMESHRKETHALLLAIQEEMKDFHGRLCAIEERRK
jgi:uncharacterized membrane-anchored protein YhcB (DUF1043 family)